MNMPSGWKKVKFGKIAKEKSKRIDNPKESVLERYVGLEHLDSGMLTVKRWGSTQDVNSAMKLFTTGDILFARRNTYLRRVSVARFDGVCSGDIIVIEPILDEIVEGFLPLYMQFEPFENKIISLSAGAFSKRIKWKQLVEEEILIPSKEEQKRFVDLIWAIEDFIEKTENLITINEKLKKGLLKELLTKGIGHTKFKKTEIGDIPEQWSVIKISDLSNVRRGASPRPIQNPDYFSDRGPGWIRIRDVTPIYKYLKETEQKLSELGASKSVRVKKGDLIMSICATIGKPVIIDMDACIHDGFVLFQELDDNKINTEYLFYILLKKEQEFISSKQVGTQGNLNTTIVGDSKFALPPSIQEQEKILNILKNIDSNIDKQTIILQNINNLKKKLTDNILKGEVKI